MNKIWIGEKYDANTLNIIDEIITPVTLMSTIPLVFKIRALMDTSSLDKKPL